MNNDTVPISLSNDIRRIPTNSGGSRISEKGFSTKKGGGVDNFAKKKKQQQTNHRSVFNSARTYQNIPLEIPGIRGGGMGVLPQKIFKKIGTKSYYSQHFWYALCTIVVLMQQEGKLLPIYEFMFLIAGIKWLILKSQVYYECINTGQLVGFVKKL